MATVRRLFAPPCLAGRGSHAVGVTGWGPARRILAAHIDHDLAADLRVGTLVPAAPEGRPAALLRTLLPFPGVSPCTGRYAARGNPAGGPWLHCAGPLRQNFCDLLCPASGPGGGVPDRTGAQTGFQRCRFGLSFISSMAEIDGHNSERSLAFRVIFGVAEMIAQVSECGGAQAFGSGCGTATGWPKGPAKRGDL